MKLANSKNFQPQDWLPTTRKEVELRGWQDLDVILVTGDAYVDHPAFGIAVIGRILEKMSLRVAIIAQPNWQDDLRDFKKLGKPRLFFGVTAGNMDSMVNHYTAQKRLRSNDAYTPAGVAGFRPDYACNVYSQILKDLFPETPVIIGGIEASLRRVTHYDYWQNRLLPSILVSSKADLLVYGMGEKAIQEISHRLLQGQAIDSLTDIAQTGFLTKNISALKLNPQNCIELHSHQDCLKSKRKYAQNFKHIETESNRMQAKTILQKIYKKILVINPPFAPFSQQELDQSFDLPFTRKPHYKYEKRGKIPAYEMIQFSVNAHRGCFGGCSFCTISAHQGKFVVSRSEASILREVEQIAKLDPFKGHITDVGGPSANMYQMKGIDLSQCRKCRRPSCIFPNICKNLNTDHSALIQLYRKIRALPSVKKLTIGSGIRYDLCAEKTAVNKTYKNELIEHHISGRLKVAPEHTDDEVLKMMRKPSFELFKKFWQEFQQRNQKLQRRQQLIPYFISGHPVSQLEHMDSLAAEIQKMNIRPEQVQDFTPTPMTLATVLYYAGIHPYTEQKVFVERDLQKKKKQKQKFFWYKQNQKNRTG